MAGAVDGVAGADGEGDAASTTHIRWDLVATSFATVCARVEYGLTWKTGKESLPFSTPRSERMRETKDIQDELRSGKLLVLVRSLTSTEEMLPITFSALSTTAKLVKPSLCINFNASVRGLSPLYIVSFVTSEKIVNHT